MAVRSRIVRFGVCAMLAVFVPLTGVAFAQSQPSLAEVAAREQKRRKAMKPAAEKKVYTNEDLGPNAEAPVPPPAPAGQTAGPGGAAPGELPASAQPQPGSSESNQPAEQDPAKTEEYWRGRMENARSELQRNELFLEALQSRINALTTDFVNRDDPAQRAVIANDRQRALAEMERVKRAVEQLKQEIVNIEEEARRAGVPPGWIR